MDLGIAGKNALVTGASRGIGAAIARHLAAEGTNLALVALRDDSEILRRMTKELGSQYKVKVEPIAADLRLEEECTRVVNQAVAALHSIDILVNNAGATPPGTLLQVSDEAWHDSWALKVFSYIRLCRAVLPHMNQRGSGRIINVIGAGGRQPRADGIVGGAANAAVMNFTKCLSLDEARFGVLVNGVNPGPVDTPRLQQREQWVGEQEGWTLEKVRKEYTLREVALGRLGQPDEIAAAVVFLASERASYITGTIFNVDGGYTIGV